jgi:hypothetical protein
MNFKDWDAYMPLLEKVDKPTLLHLAIIHTLSEQIKEHKCVWFGCRYKDWKELCALSVYQYWHAHKALVKAGVVRSVRAADDETGRPLVYHALYLDADPPNRQNSIVYGENGHDTSF